MQEQKPVLPCFGIELTACQKKIDKGIAHSNLVCDISFSIETKPKLFLADRNYRNQDYRTRTTDRNATSHFSAYYS